MGVDFVSLQNLMNSPLLSVESAALACACSEVPKVNFPRQTVSEGSLWCSCAFRSPVTIVL